MEYNPKTYWTEQGRTYMTKHLQRTKTDFTHRNRFQIQEDAIIKYLDKLYPSFETVLELGAGFGRISRLLIERYQSISKYTLVDLSAAQIKNAKKYLSHSNKTEIEYTVATIQDFYSAGKQYDLVLLSEVLMHQTPENIHHIIDIIISLSKKHIINIDWYEAKPPKIVAPHNFIHDYQKLYMQNPRIQNVIHTPIKHISQSIFHAQII